MSRVVDTCVIIDIARGDREFADTSALAIDLKRNDGLLISPLTYVELAPSFNGDSQMQDVFLGELGVECEFADGRNAVLKAHRAWYEHILRKRSGRAVKRPIADVVIGAYALDEEPMSMADWVAALDDQLKRLRARLLIGKGRITYDEAMAKAESEFEIYRAREMRQLKSDFDKAVAGYLYGDEPPKKEK